jgi:hypothetical protein
MTLVRRDSLLSMLLLIVLPTSALADRGIKDGLDRFSPKGREEAERIIEQLHNRTDKDLLIETIGELSPEERGALAVHNNPADRHRFFRELAARKAEENKVNGVYVLLYHLKAKGEISNGGILDRVRSRVARSFDVEPRGLVVLVVPPENDSLFPDEDRVRLDNDFGELRVNDPDPDRVLLSGVRFVRDTIEKNVAAGLTPAANSFHWTIVVWAGLAVIALWALLGVLRRRVLLRQGLELEPPPGAGAGPGALFGASAGLWLYEVWRNRDASGPATEVREPASVDAGQKSEAAKPDTPPA